MTSRRSCHHVHQEDSSVATPGRVAAGEEVVIARAGHPVARLVPFDPEEPRKPGLAKGRLTEAFFEPLPADELDAWQQ